MLRSIRRTDDQKGGAGFVPAGEVVEVRVLTVRIEVQHRLFGSEKDRDSPMQLVAKRDTPRMVVGRRLFIESWCNGERGEKKQATDETRENSISVLLRVAAADAKTHVTKIVFRGLESGDDRIRGVFFFGLFAEARFLFIEQLKEDACRNRTAEEPALCVNILMTRGEVVGLRLRLDTFHHDPQLEGLRHGENLGEEWRPSRRRFRWPL